MNEQSDEWDLQWKRLLTHCYGDVKADEGFKMSLLEELKRRTVERRTPAEAEPAEEAVGVPDEEERNWSRLLTHAYVPCTPRTHFKEMLFSAMKTRQTELRPSSPIAEEQEIKTILSAYAPVVPRREFQTRLLDNLKERQRVTVHLRKTSRRRTIFMSAMSGMAAAAAVLFVVWVTPMTQSRVPSSSAPVYVAQGAHSSDQVENYGGHTVLASASSLPEPFAAPASAGLALASFGNYRVSEAFDGAPLPATMRGIGVEINRGDGWQDMDETMIAAVQPGMTLRPRANTEIAGVGFGDGSTVTMRPDSVIETTDKGLAVRQGTMTVNVPANSDSKFYMHFDERDLALEPGTMLAVFVPSPENYAPGGAPAPEVKVLEGGMAVARGKGGNGILLANRAYRLDRYITADLPSRPLCFSECEDLENTLFMRPEAAAPKASYNPAQLVASEQTFMGMERVRKPMVTAGFTKKGSRWLANNYEGQPTIRVGYLSDEYFALANSRRDLASALSLGPEVVFDGGDGHFYEIVK